MLSPLRPLLSASALSASASRLFASSFATTCNWSPNSSGHGWAQLINPTSILRIYPALNDNYYYIIKNTDASPTNCSPHTDYILSDCPEGCLTGVKDALKDSLKDSKEVSKTSPPTLHIFLTHHHADHTAGLSSVQTWASSNSIPVTVHSHASIPPSTLLPSSLKISSIITHGHTPTHKSFSLPSLKTIITGDALFSMGCGRVFTGDMDAAYEGLQNLKREVEEDALVLCSHEYTESNGDFCLSLEEGFWGDDWRAVVERVEEVKVLREKGLPSVGTTFGEEKVWNPFLRVDRKEFERIRKLKDSF
ncbi:hypothetical protein TrVE_jg4590 [Triparma verrucosa]|uniref:hydroxyacylglutathione hydrolase n=1 Tax=Triparma verrucosa TaxID=1606542 RepID=A0A9W7F9A6_9STRA|nr:hypothetical protein TrVE_jg4590 [Triparma verrucosa]